MMKTTTIGMSNRDAMRVFALLLVLALVLGYATEAYAAPGDTDPGFGEDGKVATDFSGAFNESGLDLAVQGDGKVVVAGTVSRSGNDFAVARYNKDGSPDTTFGSGGQVITPVGTGSSFDEAYSVAVRPDGKIVAAGFTNNSGNVDFAVVRYNPNGSLDDSFGSGGKVVTDLGSSADFAVDVAVRGTSTILAGRSLNNSGTFDFALARYDDGGNLDTTFGQGGVVKTDFSPGFIDFGEAVTVEPGGKIVVAGSTRDPNNTAAGDDFALVRFNADGSLDDGSGSDTTPGDSFGSGGKVSTHFGSGNDVAYGVAVQEDGKIVAAGRARNDSGNDDFALARYRTNGLLDTEFDFDGKLMTDFGDGNETAWDLALQDDGRIVAAGTSGGDFALARYNPDGSPNNRFHHDGKLKTDFFGSGDDARGVAIQEDGKIVAAGFTNKPGVGRHFALARYFGGNDDTPPNVKPLVQSLPANSALGDPDAPIKLSWSATDSQGEVTRYQLQQSTDGGPYENVNLASDTATTRTVQLAPGHDYRFRVRATDDNGNTSFWKYGARFTLDAHQETSSSIAYAKTWKSQSFASAYGGKLKYATAKGAKATLSFTGTDVAWVAPKSKTRGKAAVYLDGDKVATVDLFSRQTLDRQVVFSKSNLDPAAQHTLEVRGLGTSGRPRMDVDAFVVLR